MTHKTPTIVPSVIAALLLLIGASPAAAQSYTIMPAPFQAPLNDTGSIIVGGCVWTYAAGTTTPISTYTNTSGTTNSNPIIVDGTGRFTAYLLAGTNYKFVYETACTPPAHGAVLRTADPIAGVPASAANVDFTCTAGETLSAGQAVYLSGGSGGKTQGQCYKADSANAYSSTDAIAVGIVPATIASTLPGTVRIAGSVSGLSSLSVGSPYYVGTAGAITSTPPTLARKIGGADSATSIVLSLPAPTVQTTDNGINDFRCSLTTALPVTTADVTGASAATVYVVPITGNRIALYDGSAWNVRTSAELSIAVPATTSTGYDLFVYDNASVPTVEINAWTNTTTPATAHSGASAYQDGVPIKAGTATRRYLCSFMSGTVSGQTEDSFAKRYLSNYYHRRQRALRVTEATDNWAYSTATWRQMNGAAANQLDLFVGWADVEVSATVVGFARGDAAGRLVGVAIGYDSTTTPTTGFLGGVQEAGNGAPGVRITGDLQHYPALGKHTYVALEIGAGAGTETWYGDNAGTSTQAGIHGVVQQ